MKPLAQYQEMAINKFFGMLPPGTARILEIGSDVEYAVVDNIASHFTGEIIGINPAPGFVKRAPSEGPSNVTILEADGCCMPFDDQSFDAILSIATMEHVLDVPAFLEESHRVLKPGGVFYTNFSPIWSSAIGHHVCAFAGRKEARFWKPGRNPLPDFSHLLWDEDEMREYLLDSPYDDRLIDPIIHWVYHSDSINRYFYEDYLEAFHAARLDVAVFTPGSFKAPTPDLQEMLRTKHGRHRNFSYDSIELSMTRSSKANRIPLNATQSTKAEGVDTTAHTCEIPDTVINVPMEREEIGNTVSVDTGPKHRLSSEELIVMANRRMGQYRNRHQGQRCVIIGNGPSLNKMDLSFLENEITFGMNRIFLLFDKWKFRPTYYVSVNPLVIEQSTEEILKIDAPKFLSHKGIPFFDDPGDINFIKSVPEWFFSKDPRNGICEGWTVTYVAMQLAWFMGFDEVVLIGVDHHFVTQGDPNKEVVSEGDDPNHFHPGYFGKGTRWHLPDLEHSEGSYRMAKEVFEANGRRIIDATVDGKLTIFPKADYHDLFQFGESSVTDTQDVLSQENFTPLLFSVITPSFNQARFIEQTIRSVMDQDYPDWEHIVIDGGSDDDTVHILKSFPHLNWVAEKDRGQSDAINKGLRKAEGDIIAWINSDDWYEPGAFRAVAEFFIANPEKNIVMGNCNLVDEHGAIFDQVLNYERGFDELKQHWVPRSIPTQPAIFFRRKLLDEFGLLDETLHYAMDYDLWMRFAKKNRFYSLGITVANYRFHGDAKGGDQDWSKFLPDCLMVQDRYCPPKVSVVIPCYNYACYLAEAVQSVVSQTYEPLEILIVNDGSTDNTIEVAEQLIAATPHRRIRLINQENSGQPAASRNKGISESRGEYILPLDADDMIDPTMIEKLVKILDDNPSVAIAYCDTIRFGDVNNAYQTEEWNPQRLASVNTLNYCSLFRKQVWEAVGGYRLNCGYEDWDFWISAAEKGFVGRRIPEYLFHYRIKQSGRLVLDQQNDELNKAIIVTNHSALYDKATIDWAIGTLNITSSSQQSLKVLFVVHNFPPNWYAGVEVYSQQLALTLIRHGINVSVLYPQHKAGLSLPVIEESTFEGITIYKLLSDQNSPEYGGLASQVANAEQERLFADFLQQQSFDTVHFHHTLGMPFSFMKIARQSGHRVCVTLHDFWYLCIAIHLYNSGSHTLCAGPNSSVDCAKCFLAKIGSSANKEERTMLEEWIKFRTSYAIEALNNADYVVSPSQYLANIYKRCGVSKKIEVSPLGLQSVRPTRRTPGHPVTFGFLGNIHDLKNVYMLASAFKNVTGAATLSYFGSGSAYHINRLLAEIEGDFRISYHGAYSPAQLADIFDQVDVVIVPSISENYPLVVREALSAGVPVIASIVGGIPEIISHNENGILFDPRDEQDLTRIIQKIADNPGLIAQMKNSIVPVKSMEDDANEWIGRYRELAPGYGHASAQSGKIIQESVSNPISVAVYSLDAPDEACARLRLLSPIEASAGTIESSWGVVSNGTNCTTNLDLIDQSDIIVIQRFYPRKGTIPYMERMLASGKPVIYEVDDLLIDLPDSHNLKFWARETAELLPWLLPKVSAITVSTPALAQKFSAFNPSVHIVPNVVDTSLFRPNSLKPNGSTVIGFCGTSTHAHDLEHIESALLRVADKYGNDVAFSFIGHASSRLSSLPGFKLMEFQKNYADYGRALSSCGIDIAVVPLADNRFNRCKSNIKWLEYSACGIAGIFADLQPYNSSIAHGRTGLLVMNDPEKWYQAICLLIDHPDLRRTITHQAHQEVLERYNLLNSTNTLDNVYKTIIDNFSNTILAHNLHKSI